MPMNDRGFYIPVLSALTLAAFVLLIRFFPDVTNWELCEASRCTVQDWLAATAGWVGFLAAAVGAYFVYHQLAEQRRQLHSRSEMAIPSFRSTSTLSTTHVRFCASSIGTGVPSPFTGSGSGARMSQFPCRSSFAGLRTNSRPAESSTTAGSMRQDGSTQCLA